MSETAQSSPSAPPPGAGRAAQHLLLASDPRFKKHTAAVERVLNSFEHVNEWADFITFLSKLLKQLQTQPPFPLVPHTLTVSKRLAQCLNPALPAGVHQRALDVYSHIFSLIGVNGLKRDLPAWSSGLFPFFGVAATNVRPIVLGIFTKYYLPLEKALRPATKALTLALLPGLEEEGSEFFDKVATLFDSISLSVEPVFFLQTLYLILLTNSASRMAALNYLNRRVPKTAVDDSLSHIIGSDTGLLVRGYAATLQDDNILVQRASLDAIILVSPLNSRAFREEMRPESRLLLMTSALSVVLRRDLSLSRRLHSWLLGPDADSDAQTEFIKKYSLPEVTRALKTMIWNLDANTSLRQKPYKILISLLDKWEIGSLLTDTVVIDAFASVFASITKEASSSLTTMPTTTTINSTSTSSSNDVLMATASMLVDALDPFYTWKNFYLAVQDTFLLDDSGKHNDDNHYILLTNFVVTSFPQIEEEVKRLHFPILFFSLLEFVKTTIIEHGCSIQSSKNRLQSAFILLENLFTHIPNNLFDVDTPTHSSSKHDEQPIQIAQRIYNTPSPQHNPSSPSSSSSSSRIELSSLGVHLHSCGLSILTELTQHLACKISSNKEDKDEKEKEQEQEQDKNSTIIIYIRSLALLSSLAKLRPNHTSTISLTQMQFDEWKSVQLQCLQLQYNNNNNNTNNNNLTTTTTTTTSSPILQFSLCKTISIALVDLCWGANFTVKSSLDDNDSIDIIVSSILHFLRKPYVTFYQESVNLFWKIHHFAPKPAESVISRKMKSSPLSLSLSSPSTSSALFYESFGNLWRLSDEKTTMFWISLQEPLFIMLAALDSTTDLDARQAAEAWMRCSIVSYLRLLDPIIGHLLHPSIHRKKVPITYAGASVQIIQYQYDHDEQHLLQQKQQQQHILSVLTSLLAIIRFGGQSFSRATKNAMLRDAPDPWLRERLAFYTLDSLSYMDGLVQILSDFLKSEIPADHLNDERFKENKNTNSPSFTQNEQIQHTSLEILHTLISRDQVDVHILQVLEDTLTSRLFLCIQRRELTLQNRLLRVLHSTMNAISTSLKRTHRLQQQQQQQQQFQQNSAFSSPDQRPSSAPPLDRSERTHEGNNNTNNNNNNNNNERKSPSPPTFKPHPLLIRTIVDGLTLRGQSIPVQHWVDFLLMALPIFQEAVYPVIFPLLDTLSNYLLNVVVDFDPSSSISPSSSSTSTSSQLRRTSLSDSDFSSLMSAYERFLHVAIESSSLLTEEELNDALAKQDAHESTGFFGYVSNVLSSNENVSSAHSTEKITKTQRTVQEKIVTGVKVFIEIWNLYEPVADEKEKQEETLHQKQQQDHLSVKQHQRGGAGGNVGGHHRQQPSISASAAASITISPHTTPLTSSQVNLAPDFSSSFGQDLSSKMRSRTRKSAEKIYKARKMEFLEALILHWYRAGKSSHLYFESQFCKSCCSLLEELSPNAQTEVRMLCENILGRLNIPSAFQASDQAQTESVQNSNVTTDMLFSYLELYFKRTGNLTAVQVWNVTISFVKDILAAGSSVSQTTLIKCLVCYIVLADKIATTSALHDRRFRRDLQDTFLRLVDNVMNVRKTESHARPTSDSNLSGISADEKLETESEKRPASPFMPFSPVNVELSVLMGEHVIPNLTNYMIESDKSGPLCNNIVQQIVSPFFRSKNRVLDIDESILNILMQVSKVAASLKSWKNLVTDVFFDQKFFHTSLQVVQKWRPLINALMSGDRERFNDLVSKISTANSVNIFTNREYEMTVRAMSLRRLSFTIFAGEKNVYVIKLPSIQEKLVELLRANVGDRVHREVYLCLRVLLCRVSHIHLSSLWPVILTELLRLFETLMESFSNANREYTLLILSACKFLDLLLVLQTEDFQIHEWMFVTDTTDAVYPPEGEWTPEAIMDRLSDIMNRRSGPVANQLPGIPDYTSWEPCRYDEGTGEKRSRRPMLANLRHTDVTSLSTLEPFFQRVSWMTYEGVYSGFGVDYDSVEASIELDMTDTIV